MASDDSYVNHDIVPPELLSVSIYSNNQDSTWAKPGDTVFVKFLANEALDNLDIIISNSISSYIDDGAANYRGYHIMEENDEEGEKDDDYSDEDEDYEEEEYDDDDELDELLMGGGKKDYYKNLNYKKIDPVIFDPKSIPVTVLVCAFSMFHNTSDTGSFICLIVILFFKTTFPTKTT